MIEPSEARPDRGNGKARPREKSLLIADAARVAIDTHLFRSASARPPRALCLRRDRCGRCSRRIGFAGAGLELSHLGQHRSQPTSPSQLPSRKLLDRLGLRQRRRAAPAFFIGDEAGLGNFRAASDYWGKKPSAGGTLAQLQSTWQETAL